MPRGVYKRNKLTKSEARARAEKAAETRAVNKQMAAILAQPQPSVQVVPHTERYLALACLKMILEM